MSDLSTMTLDDLFATPKVKAKPKAKPKAAPCAPARTPVQSRWEATGRVLLVSQVQCATCHEVFQSPETILVELHSKAGLRWLEAEHPQRNDHRLELKVERQPLRQIPICHHCLESKGAVPDSQLDLLRDTELGWWTKWGFCQPEVETLIDEVLLELRHD